VTSAGLVHVEVNICWMADAQQVN